MLYGSLTKIYERIESLTSRTEMTDLLIELLSDVEEKDMEASIRLTQGKIFPGYSGLEMGIGEKMVLKAMSHITSISTIEAETLYKNIGDIGKTVEMISSKRKQAVLFNEPLTVSRVYNNMLRIARSEGRSSQDMKYRIIAEMMHDASPMESKYIARTLCQKMRIGISDMTLIDALSYVFLDGPNEFPELTMSDNFPETLKNSLREIKSRRLSIFNNSIELLYKEYKHGKDKQNAKKALEYLKKMKNNAQLLRSSILRAYNIHPDLSHIAYLMKVNSSSILDSISVECGVPIMSMLGERLHSLEEIIEKLGGSCALEYKYDGLRLQAHCKFQDGVIKTQLFSRQLDNVTDQFPEINDALTKESRYECIIDGECVPVDPDTGELLPFQVISQRRGRKFEINRVIEEIPVRFVIFDCMLFNGNDMTPSPYQKRRSCIERIFPDIKDSISFTSILSISKMKIVEKKDEAQIFFDESIKDGCEGIMAKSITEDSIYQAGGRGFLWIKYKKEYMKEIVDTIDLVVIGGFKGTGKRGGLIGAYLGAVYDPDKDSFQTLCKIGSGFKDDDLKKMDDLVKPFIMDDWGHKFNIDSRIIPDIFIEPKMVIEVIGAEISYSPVHTCCRNLNRNGSGMALRFPRFTGKYRFDKSPRQSTTTREIQRLYEEQVKSMRT